MTRRRSEQGIHESGYRFPSASKTSHPPKTSQADPHTVLLTGANGYPGQFMTIDWLEHLTPVNGTLVRIVRSTDDTDARHRLEPAFADDPAFTERYADLANSLEVLAGDVSECHLGLNEERRQDLPLGMDLIAHAAAP